MRVSHETGVSHETKSDDRLAFTPREAAAMLSISERTLFSLTKRGELRSRKVGRSVRYYRADLIAFMEREGGNGEHHQ